MNSATAVLVLGMHRSGTSAVAGFLHQAGLALPTGRILPPHPDDNPEGYHESAEVVAINNRLLRALGLSWQSARPISDDELAGSKTQGEAAAIDDWLATQSGQRSLLLKDPRLCRLLPLWQPRLAAAGRKVLVVHVVRCPQAVAQSLARRGQNPGLAAAAITDEHQAHRLWLRYNLDGWQHSRSLPVIRLAYDQFVSRVAVRERLIRQVQKHLPGIELSRPRMQFHRGRARNDASSGAPPHWRRVLQHAHAAWIETSPTEQTSDWLAMLYRQFDDRVAMPYPEPEVGLSLARAALEGFAAGVAVPQRKPRRRWWDFQSGIRHWLYLNPNPQTRAHLYRVARPVDALQAQGLAAGWTTPAAVSLDQVRHAQAVIIHRAEWNDQIAAIVAECRKQGTPVGFDVDDLVVDPSVLDQGWIRFIRDLNNDQQAQWTQRIMAWRRTLLAADFAVVPTEALAEWIRHLMPDRPVLVKPNGFAPAQIGLVDAWRHARPPQAARQLLYASGTPTHDHDFAAIVPAVGAFLRAHPDWRLVLVGPVSESVWKAYLPEQQVQRRPLVAHLNLWAEYTLGGISLAPLEPDNPFCDAKSPLKWFEAALVGVPSLVTANPTYLACTRHQETAWQCVSQDDWLAGLNALAKSPALRRQMAEQARKVVLEQLDETRLMEHFVEAWMRAFG